MRQRKRCYDVTLARQEGSTKRHLASALVLQTGRPVETQDVFLTFGGPVYANRIKIYFNVTY